MSIRFFKLNKGFTLVELLVAIMIFVVMTAIMALRYGDFSKRIVLTNLAYDVALTLRQAQSYSINVSDISDTGQDGDFQKAYGVYFNLNNPRTFILFRDTTGTVRGIYDTGDQVIKTYTIKNGMKILDLCYNVYRESGCAVRAGNGVVNIAYMRPNPAPLINGSRNILQIDLVFSDAAGNVKRVYVRSSGQISVEDIL